MQDVPQTRASCADVLAAPPHLIAEVIGGRLVTHPRPAPRHVASSSVSGGFLVGLYQLGRGGPGGCWILDEPVVAPPFADAPFYLDLLWGDPAR